MLRPKIIRINAAELNVWCELANEISEHPLFKECDFDHVKIVSKEITPDPVIKDIEKPIIRLECFIRNNANRSVHFVLCRGRAKKEYQSKQRK